MALKPNFFLKSPVRHHESNELDGDK